MLNQVIMMGRLTKDPELRHTQNNTPVTTFTLAVDRESRDGGTDFFVVTAWKGTAENVARYVGKGDMVAVSGSLQTRDWTDKDGKDHTVYEVVAGRVYFTGQKRREAPKPVAVEGFTDLDALDEDLPY